MPCRESGRGFTLVELVVVVAISAIIGAIAPTVIGRTRAATHGRVACCLRQSLAPAWLAVPANSIWSGGYDAL